MKFYIFFGEFGQKVIYMLFWTINRSDIWWALNVMISKSQCAKSLWNFFIFAVFGLKESEKCLALREKLAWFLMLVSVSFGFVFTDDLMNWESVRSWDNMRYFNECESWDYSHWSAFAFRCRSNSIKVWKLLYKIKFLLY